MAGSSVSAAAQDFILQCLRKEPHQRPSTTDLLRHPWMEVRMHGCFPCEFMRYGFQCMRCLVKTGLQANN